MNTPHNGEVDENADDSTNANREASSPSPGCTGNANTELCQRIRHAAKWHDQTMHAGAISENDRVQLCRPQAERDPAKLEKQSIGKKTPKKKITKQERQRKDTHIRNYTKKTFFL